MQHKHEECAGKLLCSNKETMEAMCVGFLIGHVSGNPLSKTTYPNPELRCDKAIGFFLGGFFFLGFGK